MPRQIPIAEARDKFTQIVHHVERGDAVELTRRGKPVAALVSIAQYRHMVERVRSLWTSIEGFRGALSAHDLESLERAFDDLRDPTPGRRVEL